MSTYDDYAAQLRAAYDIFTLAITGVYLGLQGAGRGVEAAPELRAQCTALLDAFSNNAWGLTGRYLNTLPDGPDHSPRADHLFAELKRIAAKNVNDLVVRQMGLGLQRPADLFNRPAGAVGLLLQQKMSRPQFTTRDSAGRAWDAAKLVSLLARDFAYQSYIDVMLARQQAAGADKIDVVYDNAERNTTLDLADAIANRKTIFHVNGTARIQSHVPTKPHL